MQKRRRTQMGRHLRPTRVIMWLAALKGCRPLISKCASHARAHAL